MGYLSFIAPGSLCEIIGAKKAQPHEALVANNVGVRALRWDMGRGTAEGAKHLS